MAVSASELIRATLEEKLKRYEGLRALAAHERRDTAYLDRCLDELRRTLAAYRRRDRTRARAEGPSVGGQDGGRA